MDKECNKTTPPFGLGEVIAVNTIIGLSNIREQTLMLYVDNIPEISKLLVIYCDLTFQHSAIGFPPGITVDKDDIIRPKSPNRSVLALLSQIASAEIKPVCVTAPEDSTTISILDETSPNEYDTNM